MKDFIITCLWMAFIVLSLCIWQGVFTNVYSVMSLSFIGLFLIGYHIRNGTSKLRKVGLL